MEGTSSPYSNAPGRSSDGGGVLWGECPNRHIGTATVIDIAGDDDGAFDDGTSRDRSTLVDDDIDHGSCA
jgi:hypothetical protein